MNLQQAVGGYKTRVEDFLSQQLTDLKLGDDKLKHAMQYSLLLGGKRLRPFLVYATGELFGVDKADLDAPAAALEAIHTYSLIHDDLPAMDDDELRRGQLTSHKKFDEATAILAGDTLQTLAFQILVNHDYKQVSAEQVLELVRLLSQNSIYMCAGQSIDLQQTDSVIEDADTALVQLKNMHKLKTGALIKASVLMGASAGNASAQEVEILTRYAEAIGLAFQVWDDVLDIISDTDTLGKPQGSDVEANKMTYPAILGLQGARQKAQDLVAQAVQDLELLPYNTQLLQQLANYIIERDH